MHALCLQMITRNTLVDYLRIWCQKGYPPPDPLKRPTVRQYDFQLQRGRGLRYLRDFRSLAA